MFKRLKARIKEWNDKQHARALQRMQSIMRARAEREKMAEASWGRSAVEALCAHVREVGLDATVEEERNLGMGDWCGSVKIANRNVDVVELWHWWHGLGEYSRPEDRFGCFFVVRGEFGGPGDRLGAEGKRVRKSLRSRQVIDFRWRGKELARLLNDDADLRSLLLSQQRLQKISITHYREDHCIRISRKWARWNLGYLRLGDAGYSSPSEAFPTIKEFEVCDRIAQHVRSIAHARTRG